MHEGPEAKCAHQDSCDGACSTTTGAACADPVGTQSVNAEEPMSGFAGTITHPPGGGIRVLFAHTVFLRSK